MSALSLLFVAAIVVAMAAIVWTSVGGRRRTRRIAAVADAFHLRFEPDGAPLLAEGLAALPLFTVAASRGQSRIANAMSGEIDGVAVRMCDYSYRTRAHSDQWFEYAQTVVCFRVGGPRCPAFTAYPIAPRPLGTTRHLGLDTHGAITARALPLSVRDRRWDVAAGIVARADAPAVPANPFPRFADTYRLSGRDSLEVSKLFSVGFPEALLRYQKRPLSLECSGAWLAIYSDNRRIPAGELGGFVRQCACIRRTLFGALPRQGLAGP